MFEFGINGILDLIFNGGAMNRMRREESQDQESYANYAGEVGEGQQAFQKGILDIMQGRGAGALPSASGVLGGEDVFTVKPVNPLDPQAMNTAINQLALQLRNPEIPDFVSSNKAAYADKALAMRPDYAGAVAGQIGSRAEKQYDTNKDMDREKQRENRETRRILAPYLDQKGRDILSSIPAGQDIMDDPRGSQLFEEVRIKQLDEDINQFAQKQGISFGYDKARMRESFGYDVARMNKSKELSVGGEGSGKIGGFTMDQVAGLSNDLEKGFDDWMPGLSGISDYKNEAGSAAVAQDSALYGVARTKMDAEVLKSKIQQSIRKEYLSGIKQGHNPLEAQETAKQKGAEYLRRFLQGDALRVAQDVGFLDLSKAASPEEPQTSPWGKWLEEQVSRAGKYAKSNSKEAKALYEQEREMTPAQKELEKAKKRQPDFVQEYLKRALAPAPGVRSLWGIK